MVEIGGLAEDQEIILCHRAANILMQTAVVGGNSTVSSASAGDSKMFNVSGCESTELVVHAFGNFLSDCVSSQCVDWTRCTSNDIWEVYDTLGIEACCYVLFDQIKAVVSFDGTYVDDRHIILIVDTVCRMGTLI